MKQRSAGQCSSSSSSSSRCSHGSSHGALRDEPFLNTAHLMLPTQHKPLGTTHLTPPAQYFPLGATHLMPLTWCRLLGRIPPSVILRRLSTQRHKRHTQAPVHPVLQVSYTGACPPSYIGVHPSMPCCWARLLCKGTAAAAQQNKDPRIACGEHQVDSAAHALAEHSSSHTPQGRTGRNTAETGHHT